MNVETVFLDLGHTLAEPDYGALAKIYIDEGLELGPEDLRRAGARTRPELDRYLGSRGESTESSDSVLTLLGLVYDDLGVAQQIRKKLTERLVTAIPRVEYLPTKGCEDALRRLARTNVTMAVVSNSDGGADRRVRQAGLRKYFSAVLDSGLLGVEKPDPRIFEIALDSVGRRPETAIHVGDLPSVDIAGARAAGITGILIDPYRVFLEVDAPVIRSLAELPDLLPQL